MSPASTSVEADLDSWRHRIPADFPSRLGLSYLETLRAIFGFGTRVALLKLVAAKSMLKISTIDTQSERRLVVEGKLIAPWLAELTRAWKSAGEELRGRRLIIDLGNATVISREGEDALFDLMQDGARFSCSGVLTRHLLKRLAHRRQAQIRNLNRICSGD
jgi:hypothetical protein